MKISENTPRIYVGTYGMYNSGSLYGKWFDLSAYTDTQECKYPKITDCLNTDKPTFCAFVNSPTSIFHNTLLYNNTKCICCIESASIGKLQGTV